MINSLIREAEIVTSTDIPPDFGVHAEGPIADEEMGTVEIPPTDPPLDEEDLEDFLCHIDTMSPFEDFGLQHYIELWCAVLHAG